MSLQDVRKKVKDWSYKPFILPGNLGQTSVLTNIQDHISLVVRSVKSGLNQLL